MNKALAVVLGVFVVLLISVLSFIMAPTLRGVFNRQDFAVKKVDEYTSYDKIKRVEDTCRAMISSYESDRLTYEQYRDSDNKEKQSWAEQAKMRANKTASTYNNYILENSFVWSHNVPEDIKKELEIIE
jgi:hypothetical protein